jgi:hypothetical protein
LDTNGDVSRAEFDRAEASAIEEFTSWKHPVPRAARRKIADRSRGLYRAPMDEPGWTAYYVEAVKKYAPGPEVDDCGLMTSANGWVVVSPESKRSGKLAAQVTYCDRRDVTYMLPLGLLTANGKTFWAFQLSGFGPRGLRRSRSPRPSGSEVHVKYSAGLCAPRMFGR